MYHVVIFVVRDFKKAGCNLVNCEPNTVDYLRPFFLSVIKNINEIRFCAVIRLTAQTQLEAQIEEEA